MLYRDDNQTTIDVAFTPNLRTTLGRINDNDRELYYAYHLPHYLTHFLSFSLLAFFFGFVLNEVTYNEARNEGLQELLYSPAPRNKTEVSFVFSLNLNALQGGFEFGGKSLTWTMQSYSYYYCSTAGGDISFGAAVIRPTFTFDPDDAPEDRIVTFSVIRDNIVEGQEIGQLQIARSTFIWWFHTTVPECENHYQRFKQWVQLARDQTVLVLQGNLYIVVMLEAMLARDSVEPGHSQLARDSVELWSQLS